MPNIIALKGEQTIYQARETQHQLAVALQAEVEIKLDLAAVSEVDSSLIQMLLWLQSEGLRLHKPVLLLNPSAAILQVVTLLGLQDCLIFAGVR